MSVPYWVSDAIFYQIFPDRFANGDPATTPPNAEPWGSPPTIWNFMGGDLRGIIQHLDYLLDLGVNALYLNPIFQAVSNHRYNATDYYKIDPKLGSRADFDALLNAAHGNGMRVVLDGVFNHCGRGFFAFNDVLENGQHSPYKDWFHIRRLPVDAYSPGPAEDYLGWWKHKGLPKFNIENPDVRKYLLDVARYWIAQGVDGWRLDVPNEIDDDSFWTDFRQVVKKENPDAYLVGEIWDADSRWVGDTHFDGLMNYPVAKALLPWLNGQGTTASQLAQQLEELFALYPRENMYAMYLPLGSHDTERVRTVLGGSLEKVRAAFAFQFAFPGAPAIYYGDEIGLTGGGDPECRKAFPWDEKEWQADLRRWVQTLIALRKRIPALRRGNYRGLASDDRRQTFAFTRSLGQESVLVAVNASPYRRHLSLPVADLHWQDGRILRDLFSQQEFIVSGDTLHLTLLPYGVMWVK